MTSEDGEMWADIRHHSQEKRARNRMNSTEIIRTWAAQKGGIIMTFNASHLRVNERFDFWPGTGKWLDRVRNVYGRGVFNLIKALQANMTNNEQ